MVNWSMIVDIYVRVGHFALTGIFIDEMIRLSIENTISELYIIV